MEGAGVTNYNVDKPSYGFTTATTQFDDALLKHGVVNRTQTLVAKGASVKQAQELLQKEQQAKDAWNKKQVKHWNADEDNKGSRSDDDDDNCDSYDDLWNDEDEEVLQRYRQLRLNELKESSERQDKSRGIVESIHRDEWIPKVNEASRDGTRVVICLTTASARHDFLEACTVLARRHRHVVFVTLPAKEALGPDWPHPEPSLLVYRHGKLEHEFFRLTALSANDLDTTLCKVWQDE